LQRWKLINAASRAKTVFQVNIISMSQKHAGIFIDMTWTLLGIAVRGEMSSISKVE